MKKQKIDYQQLYEWMDKYTEYASVTVRNERLVFSVNHKWEYKVTHGKEIIYKGASMACAIDAWYSV